jgi:hypothetical protein
MKNKQVFVCNYKNMENKHSHGSGNSGFFLGFLLGVVVTLLFTTKRGRSIVRLLTEEGAKKIDSWKDVLEATEEEFFEDEGLIDDEPLVTEEAPVKPTEHTERKTEKTATSATSSREKPKDTAKRSLRFFRRPGK